MKICVTSREEDPFSIMENNFSSCKCFIIYDTELRDYKILKNINKKNISDFDIFKKMVYEKVDVIITGNFEKHLFNINRKYGIKVYTVFNMRVFEAIEKFLGNDLFY